MRHVAIHFEMPNPTPLITYLLKTCPIVYTVQGCLHPVMSVISID